MMRESQGNLMNERSHLKVARQCVSQIAFSVCVHNTCVCISVCVSVCVCTWPNAIHQKERSMRELKSRPLTAPAFVSHYTMLNPSPHSQSCCGDMPAAAASGRASAMLRGCGKVTGRCLTEPRRDTGVASTDWSALEFTSAGRRANTDRVFSLSG